MAASLTIHLVTFLAATAWVHHERQRMIEYLMTENEVLQEKIDQLLKRLGRKRLMLSDDQRRRLAAKAKPLGVRRLGEICRIFTPQTILDWHRRLVAQKWTHPPKSTGRPRIEKEVVALVVKLARENHSWGYDRIVGELKKLGHPISKTSVENILKDQGIEPAPKRKSQTSWKEFLNAHWECLAAIDFTTVEVWTPTGLKTIYLLFAMELKTRKVQFLGSTAHPNEQWMAEAAERAIADDGILGGENHPTILLMDRDTKFTAKFKKKLIEEKVKPHLTAPRAPKMNAYMERFIGSYKRELVHRMIFFGKQTLDHATEQYLLHYHEDRPHQGLDNELILPMKPPDMTAPVQVTERLGGLLKSYRRQAA